MVSSFGCGWGSCYPAFLRALQQAAPYMARQPDLEVVLGGEGSWGEGADPGRRWAALLESGQRDGEELRAAWAALQLEARECAEYLGTATHGGTGGKRVKKKHYNWFYLHLFSLELQGLY